MTRDLKPDYHDLQQIVERYGSVAHAAAAIGVSQDEFQEWLSGRKAIPPEYYDALLNLVGRKQ